MAVVLPLYIVLPLIATCVSSSAGVYTLLVSAFVIYPLIIDLCAVIDQSGQYQGRIVNLFAGRNLLSLGIRSNAVVFPWH